jgi:2-iminobutanoate/2-iminopropanoate deaminase
MLENRKAAPPLYATLAAMRTLCIFVLALLPLTAQKKVIAPPEIPPSPNFSAAILADGTLYVSGMIGQSLKTKEIPADFESEVMTVLANIGIVLKAAGMDYKDVISVQVYLTDMDLFPRMNAVYTTVFKEPRPSRTTVGVTKLAAAAAHIEVTVTARK